MRQLVSGGIIYDEPTGCANIPAARTIEPDKEARMAKPHSNATAPESKPQDRRVQ